MNPVSDFLEALVSMLPREAGGRSTPVLPRDGSYRPFARVAGEERIVRVRFIEGPPVLAPGDSARVMVEIETNNVDLPLGGELDLFEHDLQPVGIMTVTRVWRAAISA